MHTGEELAAALGEGPTHRPRGARLRAAQRGGGPPAGLSLLARADGRAPGADAARGAARDPGGAEGSPRSSSSAWGYNTLWERNGRRHAYWAARFRREASSLIAALRRAGAEQLVWVTLRRVNRRTTSPRNWGELHYYSWYFGWVNDELRTLDQQRDRLVLADWEHVGARPDVTYDSIHLNSRGGRLMQRVIERTIYEEAYRQAAL